MNTKQKLLSRSLLASLLTVLVLILNFNDLVAIRFSRSYGNLLNSDRDTGSIDKSRAGLKRASSFSSGSDISDRDVSDSDASDSDTSSRNKFKRVSAAAVGMFKRASIVIDTEKKLTFIRQRWEKARQRAHVAAEGAAASVAPRLKRSPVIVPSAPKDTFELVDLGDTVPSQASTVRILLVASPIISLRTAVVSPRVYFHACFGNK